ncbi:hypothetical protein CGZ98_07705 [Enemella evansiae]|uniref:hypothetical protein n=1 Tax=Enemella evansiae TaxID=2016499 RepID=UPI000B96C63D|nr:hypothetical protein [Enemella evansiae]OYO12066.1 hypothetical protein CGZ98_07705 [Enemella evansiae]
MTAGVIYLTSEREQYYKYDALTETATPAGFIEVDERFCFDSAVKPTKAEVDGDIESLRPVWNAAHPRGEKPEDAIYIEGVAIRVATKAGSSLGAQGYAIDRDYLEE